MTSGGGENESDHSPLISDGGYKTVQEGDDNEPLPWEYSDGDDDCLGELCCAAAKLDEGIVSSASRTIDSRRLISPPETLTKALCSCGQQQQQPDVATCSRTAAIAASNCYRRASSFRVGANHPLVMSNSGGGSGGGSGSVGAGSSAPRTHVTATMADIRFTTKSPLSAENESLTTDATITPSDGRSFEACKNSSPPMYGHYSPPSAAHQRKPSISTLTGVQEFSTPPTWQELRRLDDLSAPLKLLHEKETNWSAICGALQDVRRLVLHHPEAVNLIVRKDSSMLLSLIPRILELIDNPRSLVAKNAVTTLHDIFLFTPAHVPGSLIFDCLHCIMRRATGTSFIAEAAQRCLEQMIIGGDTFRTLHALMTILTKEGRNFVTLRQMALYASGIFLLRTTAQSLQAVVQHKDFVNSFLKPIVRATNDANQECRAAAAECCVILINLWPDVRFKFKNYASEFDLSAALVRAKKLFKPLNSYYNMEAVAQAYARCPDNATIELAFDRLQIILANMAEISSQPLELESPPYVGVAPVSRSVTPSSKGRRLSPGGRLMGLSTRRPTFRSPPAGSSTSVEREYDLSSRGMLKIAPIDRLTSPPDRYNALTVCERSEAAPPPSNRTQQLYLPSKRVMPAVDQPPPPPRESSSRVLTQQRYSFEGDGRKLVQLKRTAPSEEFDEAHLPAYATRGNLRYVQRCTVDEQQRRRRGL